jgi:hypothetical protein
MTHAIAQLVVVADATPRQVMALQHVFAVIPLQQYYTLCAKLFSLVT